MTAFPPGTSGDFGGLLPTVLPADPMPLLTSWFGRARTERVAPNPNAMALATIDGQGRPSVRIVLCKRLGADGTLDFYTNYQGRKGRELETRPEGAACFFWDTLDLQARLEGPVGRVPDAESDAYFASRPWASKVGAWASDQSRPIGSHAELLAKVADAMRRFGVDPDRPPPPGAQVEIPRPPHWGGFRLTARRVELWISGPGRVHDRAEWTRALPERAGARPPAAWLAGRLQP